MKRTPWIERKFDFNLPEGWIFNELERLEGTLSRISHLMDQLSEEEASIRLNDAWSAKEQIGHLYDLENLHISRIYEIKEGKDVLSPADMKNLLTESSNHNSLSKNELYKMFAERRTKFIALIRGLSDEDQYHGALHERLNVKMRPIDVASFTATHDDHHLVYVSNIVRHFRS